MEIEHNIKPNICIIPKPNAPLPNFTHEKSFQFQRNIMYFYADSS
jgi:hypothetical protein